jgi:hypothetical protein
MHGDNAVVDQLFKRTLNIYELRSGLCLGLPIHDPLLKLNIQSYSAYA